MITRERERERARAMDVLGSQSQSDADIRKQWQLDRSEVLVKSELRLVRVKDRGPTRRNDDPADEQPDRSLGSVTRILATQRSCDVEHKSYSSIVRKPLTGSAQYCRGEFAPSSIHAHAYFPQSDAPEWITE
ncbi:hypothetical protein Mp_4g11660 [Marchantia polymorpha subsp. ruderalis]|uniref:Uncharacterized protein n=2 Tax=Marchantia polymorpha TaxID=3197 RepID=A0AAF6B8W7_MARPO|nr:hypothetical protein MARPO_0011s0151 [Marchantia polymorpha]BBN08451.1 hypothetical protein Mp_4g11660 [Marchantia polymorpha subsp. ruderalis]|eukprot:PTQ46487.1 hypothetical protein MARPO_0011s0151 [Marchantia polymorpha]